MSIWAELFPDLKFICGGVCQSWAQFKSLPPVGAEFSRPTLHNVVLFCQCVQMIVHPEAFKPAQKLAIFLV